MQEEILAKQKDADLAVYAIWFNMYPTDARERWPAEVLTDSRVIHYWDEQKNAGRWYGERLRDIESQMASNSAENEGPILWDVYLVYGPEGRWDATPAGLRRWGRTILKTQDEFRRSVAALVN